MPDAIADRPDLTSADDEDDEGEDEDFLGKLGPRRAGRNASAPKRFRGIPIVPPIRAGPPPEDAVPGLRFRSLKEALEMTNKTEHGTVLRLDASTQHGPYLEVHDFPEDHDNGRVWADQLDMLVPCSIVGSAPGARLEATISIACGTLGLPEGCKISHLSWFAHRASCLYIFGGCWRISECEIRTDHPAGDSIYCRGTSKVPLPDHSTRQGNLVADVVQGTHRFLKFPQVELTVDSCGLGGLRAGVPAGWGVCVTEKAKFSISDSRIEWVHQALAVVDMVRAKVKGCTMSHTGNALWFGNSCEVSMTSCTIQDTVCAFSLRTMSDRGTKCGNAAQDDDDGQRARLQLRGCRVSSMGYFEGNRRPGYFVNQTSIFTMPLAPVMTFDHSSTNFHELLPHKKRNAMQSPGFWR